MAKFFAGSLPPGPAGDAILQLLTGHEVNYRFSERIDELVGYLQNLKDSTDFRPTGGHVIEATENSISNRTGSVQRLAAGHTSFYSKPGVHKPIRAQGTSFLFQNEAIAGGGSVAISKIKRREPRVLNAVDILMGSTFDDGSDHYDVSGNSGDRSNVKEEESKEGEAPLISQTAQPPFSQGPEGTALVKEKEPGKGSRQETGAVEGLVKEEGMDEEVNDSGEQGDHVREKETEKAHQDVPDLPPPRHFNLGIYSCNVCNFVCRSYDPLKWHHEHFHPLCNECGIRFSSRKTLFEHQRLKYVACDVCGKSLASKGSLKRHKRLHGERAFKCDVCQKGFISESDLMKHWPSHTLKRAYECDVCQKTLSSSKSLARHHLCVHDLSKRDDSMIE